MKASLQGSAAAEQPVIAEPFDYESIPPGYYDEVFHRRRGIQSKWHHLKFRRVVRELAGWPTVLDIGCGPGTMIGLLGDRHVAVGIDLSTNQIEYARSTYGGPGASFHNASPADLPGDVGPFDAVTMVELVEHLEPRVVDQIISEALECVRPGGKFVITTPNFHSVWPLIEALINRFGEVKYQFQHINKFTRQGLTRLLESHGLVDIRVEPYLFVAPFAAAVNWHLAGRVAQIEQGPLEQHFGMLLLGSALKPE
jgi:2-polyprenyl-3-methyl-5-hydroxy-6-metoxy-1,4-benzoquinol methylase